MPDNDLKGRVALITGAARGIGAASAIALARRGAEVHLTDVLDTAGATGDTVSLMSLDGYTVTLDRAALTDQFVLALASECAEDGCAPLGIGGRGPVWLVFPPGAYPDFSGEDDSGLAWGLFHIGVE